MKNIDEFITNIVTKNLHEPMSYDMAIKNAFKDKNKFFIKTKIMKIVSVICSFTIIVTGIAYAKDIENYFKAMFTNSSKAIDTAVENGYVQKEEMGYVYDNKIGVKVESLVLDDLNLDIAFNFETKMKNVKAIRLNDFIITNDNNKVVYRSEFKEAKTLEELPIYNSVDWINESQKLTDTTFTDSILFGLRPEKEDFKELYFDINSIDVIYNNDTKEKIEGSWKFNVAINEEMRKKSNIEYVFEGENEYVESCKITISNTGAIMELNSKVDFPTEMTVPPFPFKIYLSIMNKNKIFRSNFSTRNDENRYMKIEYDNLGIYDVEDDDEILELYIGAWDTTLYLTRENFMK